MYRKASRAENKYVEHTAGEPKPLYKLSKNYEELFDLLSKGHTVVGFADYRSFNDDRLTGRDVCQIVRRAAWNISFFCRGISYGNVFDVCNPKGWSEKDVFIAECKAINAEFIPPN